MVQFMKSKNPNQDVLITFWQFVKATGMDYNEFKSTLGFSKKDELIIRDIWDRIHDGNIKFEIFEKEFNEKKLKGGTESLSDHILPFLKFLYSAQTGITNDKVDESINDRVNEFSYVNDFNKDIVNWDDDRIYDTYEKLYQRMPEVPFITKLLHFNEDSKRTNDPVHLYITTVERKIPGGPFTVREYDSDRDSVEEYQTKYMHCPLVYDWINGDGVEVQKPGNLRT